MKPFKECDETELKKVFVVALMPDFHIQPEAWGLHVLEQKAVRADFIIRPKPHLVARGFDDVYIAAEVKAVSSIFVASSTMWQCASYVQSIYGAKKVRPAFGIVFPDMQTVTGNVLPDNGQPTGGRLLEHIGQYMNVGFLALKPTDLANWTIRIGSVAYFSKSYGKTKLNLIKRYVGNKESAA